MDAKQVITVRVPVELHNALVEEAYQKRTSLNQLCLAKLRQTIAQELVPKTRGRCRSEPTKAEGCSLD